jgi:hypothetical protein
MNSQTTKQEQDNKSLSTQYRLAKDEFKSRIDFSVYDLILVCIPAFVFISITISTFTSIQIMTGIIWSAAVSAVLLGYGLFVDPPM